MFKLASESDKLLKGSRGLICFYLTSCVIALCFVVCSTLVQSLILSTHLHSIKSYVQYVIQPVANLLK